MFLFSISGWKDQILSLPKKWLSQTSADTDEFGFPEVSWRCYFVAMVCEFVVDVMERKYRLRSLNFNGDIKMLLLHMDGVASPITYRSYPNVQLLMNFNAKVKPQIIELKV